MKQLHGLFIGIDRFASPAINNLTCAVRDAEALHSLFADTLGGTSTVLLTDQQATRAAIIDQFEKRLTQVASDDFVMVTFSGHGSPDHHLVTHDADPANLGHTSISLEELIALFSKVPARHVVLSLDCCFSGGAGSRVFHPDPPVRALGSAEPVLAELTGKGRVVLTACDPKQEAIEDPVIGHGLMTWALLEGLQGPSEVVEHGRVPLYKLVHYVTRSVEAAAASFGRPQTPTFRGAVDGDLTLPLFHAGAEYARRFPDRVAAPIQPEVDSLAGRGIPQFIIEALRRKTPRLNELQCRAINEHGVLDGRALVVSAPTSSGKTMIGELAAISAYIARQRSIFLLPMKALVSDKYEEFKNRYGPLGLRVARATGDDSDDVPALLRGRYDFCLMTYEKAARLLIALPHLLWGVRTIVVDEAQMLADPGRGANLEFLLTLLKYRRREGVRAQLILLSAVIGDTYGLERWLGASLLKSDKRPVPLHEGVLRPNGSFRYLDDHGAEVVEPYINPEMRKGTAQDWVIPLVRRLVAAGENVIVFRETKSETANVARYLANDLGLPAASEALSELPANDPSRLSRTLLECLRQGVAFHNSDLDRDERRAVESAFRERRGIRVLVATTTLAMGVNTPASSVVICGLQHPGETPTPYTVAEYKNMVGRAGRVGYSETGKSFLIATSPKDEWESWTHYVRGQPEAISSRFLEADPRLLILRTLAAREVAKVSNLTCLGPLLLRSIPPLVPSRRDVVFLPYVTACCPASLA